jgi:hypothetical protein
VYAGLKHVGLIAGFYQHLMQVHALARTIWAQRMGLVQVDVVLG